MRDVSHFPEKNVKFARDFSDTDSKQTTLSPTLTLRSAPFGFTALLQGRVPKARKGVIFGDAKSYMDSN
jgi:hypothetical protein